MINIDDEELEDPLLRPVKKPVPTQAQPSATPRLNGTTRQPTRSALTSTSGRTATQPSISRQRPAPSTTARAAPNVRLAPGATDSQRAGTRVAPAPARINGFLVKAPVSKQPSPVVYKVDIEDQKLFESWGVEVDDEAIFDLSLGSDTE